MFTFSNAPLDDDDKDMEMFYFMTALDARLCSVKKESCCSTSQLVTTRISAFIYCFMKWVFGPNGGLGSEDSVEKV